MAIPPFPSHDLAKLVLGYLAEEQLMTAYDEFLQASPYLDIQCNEYDRIFMTSLRHILGEYRAVKIHVEKCKPFILRKKLIQCSNLLEVFKFLVSHIDLNRLHAQETSTEKSSYNRQTTYTKSNVCEVCSSHNLFTCVCKPKVGKVPAIQPTTSHIEANSIDTSIETTSLADLPGNSITKKNSSRELTAEISHTQSGLVEQTADMTVKAQNLLSSTSVEAQLSSESNLQSNPSLAYNTQDMSSVKTDESKQKIEEFNTIYNLVCSNNNSTNTPKRNNVVPENSTNKPICNAGTFQEFATGVTGNTDKEKPIVPDSSTSENFNAQTTALKQNRRNVNPITNIKGPPIAQFLFQAGTVTNPYYQANKESNNVSMADSYVKIKEKPEDQKITILSDVKVDAYRNNNFVKIPPVLRPTTSPMLQMQTIVINGTPAYSHRQPMGTNFTYTKDEIMAMPTIIVVPSSGTSQNSSATCTQSNISQSTNTITTTSNSTPHLLSPLVIDVTDSPSPTSCSHNMPKLSSEDPKNVVSEGLVKTVDVTTHTSLPKDANLDIPNKTSTPNALPLTRKSSSTPRRNSHVRVLDFATPRRILHETIKECDPNQLPTENETNDTEIRKTTDKPVHINIVVNKDKYGKEDSKAKKDTNNTSTKENKSKSKKRSNWDAELRASALGTSVYEEAAPPPKSKDKKTKKKKAAVTEIVSDTPKVAKTEKSTIYVRVKKLKKRKPTEIVEEPVKEPSNNSATDTDIVTSQSDVNVTELPTDKNQIKVNISDNVDTPEAERLSLQNVIGAKLNISDLLETPYKQALLDIQMETPKFLGTDLPGEPISDIKIMSIPTPLFLNTPKPSQATPSSYSSRPTDYSSGGSYYKPDDQDYIPPSDVLQYTATMADDMSKSTNSLDTREKEKSEKRSRPQRKCTRNVSYKSDSICKIKEDESCEAASVSSETSNRSTRDRKLNKSADSKSNLKSKTKSDSKKRIVSYKSPHKPKNFMKIKPRRATPVKEISSRGRKKTDNSDNTSLSRKRTSSKDTNTNITPVIASVPTKSRRKSSTPRKINCTKTFCTENVVQNSCNLLNSGTVKEPSTYNPQDSDTEQQPLLWSDDGSQDAKPKEEQPTSSSLPEDEDINKIKEYIETSALPNLTVPDKNTEGSLHIDLIKGGFDLDTARSIERDLLDATPIQDTAIQSTSNEEISVKNIEISLTVSDRVESDSSVANNLQIVQEETEMDETELSVHECNEESQNFISCEFDESKFVPSNGIFKLNDKYFMEVCRDDDVTIRLRAASFKSLFDMEPEELVTEYDKQETEDAVSSISNFDKLYTPMKDRRTQCYDIFNSTLTSIDTPLKTDGTSEIKVTEIILEVESIDIKDKTDTKKRKRLQSGSLEESLCKKSKPETQYLLNSANIQNIDIESVLSKLHGP